LENRLSWKHRELGDSGIVQLGNPKDGRRLCYALSLAVPVVKTETGVVIDFGFCLVRL
jgi:hypothetical protein